MLVIGVGNPDRGDDGIGWWVARRLADVCVTATSTGDAAAMIDMWQDHDDVVVVDATRCERTPGTVTIIDLLHQRLPHATVTSSHGMGPLEAVELAEALEVLPPNLTLVGVEGWRFEPGMPMSPQVRRGGDRAVQIISGWAGGTDRR